MKKIYKSIKNFLLKHPSIRNKVRSFRWRSKNIPLLGPVVAAFERGYFGSCAGERYDAINPTEANDYFESYAPILVAKARGKVIDLGCGYGYLTERIAKSNNVSKVIGVDKIADFRCKHPKIEYVTQDLAVNNNLPKDVDTVVSSEFIEHLSEDDFRKLIPQIKLALKDDGVYIGSTPLNPTKKKNFSGSPFHIREYNQKDLENLFKEFFSEVEVNPISEFCLVWEVKK